MLFKNHSWTILFNSWTFFQFIHKTIHALIFTFMNAFFNHMLFWMIFDSWTVFNSWLCFFEWYLIRERLLPMTVFLNDISFMTVFLNDISFKNDISIMTVFLNDISFKNGFHSDRFFWLIFHSWTCFLWMMLHSRIVSLMTVCEWYLIRFYYTE